MQLDFDVATELLSFRNARASVAACQDVYNNPPDISCAETDTQVRVVRGRCALRNAWVGFFFKGTFNTQGWLRDFDPTVVHFGKGYAHRDTVDGVESVLTKIRMAIESKKDAVFIGGHSKGAREAQNCAKRLIDLGVNVRQVYTFGTPRGFDYFAAKEYDVKLGDKTFRFIHGADIVCHVPFPPLWFHTKQRIYMPVRKFLGIKSVRGAWLKNPSYATILACDGREIWRELRRKKKQMASFADHHIPAYVEAVSALQ